MKKLVATTSSDLSSEAFLRGLLELRNTPSSDGCSPAQYLFGHPLRSIVPIHQRSLAPQWQTARHALDKAAVRAAKGKDLYDRSAHPLRPLRISTQVRIRDPVTKKWNLTGTVVEKLRQRSYRVRLPSGRVLQRTRAVLRPVVRDLSADHPPNPHPSPSPAAPSPPSPSGLSPPPMPPRRSSRPRLSTRRPEFKY